MTTEQVEQVASKVRPDDPYRIGFLEGVKFAEERNANLWKLDAASDTEYLHCKIRRSVWSKANKIWQAEQSSPHTYMSPQGILEWIVCRVPEMKYRNTFAEGEGFLKGFLQHRGLFGVEL